MKAVRKINLAQCVKQGDTVLQFWCHTRRKGEGARYGGGPNTCGHNADIPIDVAIDKFGAETSLSDIPAVCTKCGGRNIDIRAKSGAKSPHRHF